MQSRTFKIAIGLIATISCVSIMAKDGSLASNREPLDKVSAKVTERIMGRGDARVIVHLDTPVLREYSLSPEAKLTQRQIIADAQERLAIELSAAGALIDKVFITVPAVAMRADAAAIDIIARSDFVKTVTLDLLAAPLLHESNLLIEADQMWSQSPAIKGSGHAIAILDTGV